MKKPLIFAAVLCGCLLALPGLARETKQPGFEFCTGKRFFRKTVKLTDNKPSVSIVFKLN